MLRWRNRRAEEGQVLDLMAALQASLEAANKPRGLRRVRPAGTRD